MSSWDVEFTDEFEDWWEGLDEDGQESVYASVFLLQSRGPSLPFPHSSGVRQSAHSRMRELRVQHQGRPYRIFYAFDERRSAILLIGGDKTGNDRFYLEMVPLADRLFEEHLREVAEEFDGT